MTTRNSFHSAWSRSGQLEILRYCSNWVMENLDRFTLRENFRLILLWLWKKCLDSNFPKTILRSRSEEKLSFSRHWSMITSWNYLGTFGMKRPFILFWSMPLEDSCMDCSKNTNNSVKKTSLLSSGRSWRHSSICIRTRLSTGT